MENVPTFLRPEVAATFENPNVAASYQLRPQFPPETFSILRDLIVDEPATVLDLGCGTGFIARPLAPLVDQVDAVDVSAAMIDEGRRLPGGDHPRLNWMVGRAETVTLRPPYALATGGDSLHWMDWNVLLPRVGHALSLGGRLAILTVDGKLAAEDEVLKQGALALIRRYSTLDDWRPDFDLVSELRRRGLFLEEGRAETSSVVFTQSVDEYVESFHARASLSWGRMEPGDATAFDEAMRQLVVAYLGDLVELSVSANIVWGKPVEVP